MPFKIWKCKKCGEEFHYNDDGDEMEKVFCFEGDEMEVIKVGLH